MRYGVLSDVHGNLHALRATLDAMAAAEVDAYVCAGDIVGYGPLPNECVAVLAERAIPCVAGNHELLVLGVLPPDRSSAFALDSTEWTRSVLGADARTYIAGLPPRLELPGLLVAHGSLVDPEEYVTGVDRARRLLAEMALDRPDSSALVLGHTHHQWILADPGGTLLRRRGGAVELLPDRRHLVNPGSVGQSRDRSPDARFAVLDVDAGTAQLSSTPYDVDGCVQALRRMGRPLDSCHRRPSRLPAIRPGLDRVRRAARRVLTSP